MHLGLLRHCPIYYKATKEKDGMSTMRRMAVYGKGGAGKSTISANPSVTLARRGHRVLQIGCDLKHGSIHLLLHSKWLQIAFDLAMEVSLVGMLDCSQDFGIRSNLDVGLPWLSIPTATGGRSISLA